METSWNCVKCSRPIMLWSELFFQSFNSKMEHSQVLSVWGVFLGYLYYHVVCEAVLTIHTICSFDDHLSVLILLRQSCEREPEILSIVSNTAFALMSLSLSKLIRFGFEIGIFAYFLGCLVVQLWTINWMLISVAIIFGCPLFVMHSSLHYQEEVDRDQIIDESSGSDPEVGNAGQPDVGNESQVIIDSYPDYQQEVSSKGQVIPCSVTIPEVASCGSDQGVVDIILEANSISLLAL